MSGISIAYAGLFYLAALVLIVGLGSKIAQYWRTPAPLKIPTTPAPTTRTGAAFRVAREVTVFESLFKSDKLLWAFAVAFHAGLALVLVRHLRYFIADVPALLVLIQPIGVYAGFAMVAGLAALLARRFLIARVRYITNPSDIAMLLLLIAIGVSGLFMKFVHPTDIIAVKAFFLGLMRFSIQPLPAHPGLLVHLGLVAALMIVFPFSKLLHAPGVFFSPTRNQADDPRERRHVAPWAAGYDAKRGF
ncbi:respiratory nitrate reductase subunit gamma [Novispirillum sp. DQ9]|uniref:respiratory nitrate reductase subunit gamma n=1 Tax=Novispirillum sp. DQ9 TaxID=3398612 RepID=UPI003C7D7C0D